MLSQGCNINIWSLCCYCILESVFYWWSRDCKQASSALLDLLKKSENVSPLRLCQYYLMYVAERRSYVIRIIYKWVTAFYFQWWTKLKIKYIKFIYVFYCIFVLLPSKFRNFYHTLVSLSSTLLSFCLLFFIHWTMEMMMRSKKTPKKTMIMIKIIRSTFMLMSTICYESSCLTVSLNTFYSCFIVQFFEIVIFRNQSCSSCVLFYLIIFCSICVTEC